MPSKNRDKLKAQKARYRARLKERMKLDLELDKKIKSKRIEYHKRTYISKKKHDWHVRCRDKHIKKMSLIKYDHHVKEYAKSNRCRYIRYRKTNPRHKAIAFMRKCLWRSLRQNKSERTEVVLGYSRKDLVSHIESTFVNGMSWDNYGDWHIDHITPISWFLDNGVLCPKIINSLDNLKALWADDNQRKGSTMPINIPTQR
jgi:hypothetical protein